MANLIGLKPKIKTAKEITASFPNLIVFYKRIGRKVLVGFWTGFGREFDQWEKEMKRNNYIVYGSHDCDDSLYYGTTGIGKTHNVLKAMDELGVNYDDCEML